jgi:hypothetical protein
MDPQIALLEAASNLGIGALSSTDFEATMAPDFSLSVSNDDPHRPAPELVSSTNVAQDNDDSWAASGSKDDQDFGARAFDANESESISLSLPESFQYDSADEEEWSGDGDSEYGGGGASSPVLSPGATPILSEF